MNVLYKPKTLLTLIILVASQHVLFSQASLPGVTKGAGNALGFNGINNYVNVPLMSAINNASHLTVECWVNCNAITGVPFAHWVNYEYPVSVPVGFYISLGGTEISVATNANWTSTTTDANLQTGRWYHIACVFDGTLAGNANRLKVYVNGVLKNMDFSGQPVPVPPSLGNVSVITHIGARRGITDNLIEFMNGKEDEVRVWNVSRTQAQIRDKMCSKLTGSEAGLIGYWRMDEGTGFTAVDSQVNLPVNNGTLLNGTNWVLSGAPIGDTSTSQYAPTPVLLVVNGEKLTAQNSTGIAEGAQVYYVSAVPNTTSGISGLGTNNRYFGVFVVSDIASGYEVFYDYSGNPNITAPSACSMFKRDANDDLSWINANASLVIPVYHKAGELERGEYILANNIDTSTQTITACNSFAWHGNTYTNSGVYYDTIINATGCDSIIRLNLAINNTTSSTQAISTCNSYSWHGQAFFMSGIYHDTISNSTGCDSIFTLNLTITGAGLAVQIITACTSYSWRGNVYTISGTYNDTINNPSGCDSIYRLNLTINNNSVSTQTIRACQQYNWHGATYLGTGIYHDTIPNMMGCDSVCTLNLTIIEKHLPDLGPDIEICNGDSVFLSPGKFDAYLWQDNSTADHLMVQNAGLYSVIVTNTCGSEKDKVRITGKTCNEIFPGAFTPNQDGENDVFKILDAFNLHDYKLRIYNRWGQKVFECRDARLGWDGNFKGYKQSTGAYVYFCTYLKNNVAGKMKGSFILIR